MNAPLIVPTTGSEATARDVVVEIKDLHAGYGQVPVLHGISLSVFEDEIVGILGHNGMGKSTLLKTLMGLLPATKGSVLINGGDLTTSPAHL